jgi:hypothetical protein
VELVPPPQARQQHTYGDIAQFTAVQSWRICLVHRFISTILATLPRSQRHNLRNFALTTGSSTQSWWLS